MRPFCNRPVFLSRTESGEWSRAPHHKSRDRKNTGALEEETYRDLLLAAGFSDIEVEVTRRYVLQDIADGGASASLTALGEAERSDVDGKFVSAFIRARKPTQG